MWYVSLKCCSIIDYMNIGKSSFLKALSGKLNLGSMHLDGTVTYNGDTAGSGKFLLPKIADYIDEKEQHAATLTVQETMEFAWAATSNNHHAYGVTRTEEGEAALGALDEVKAKVDEQYLGLCSRSVRYQDYRNSTWS